MDNVRLKMGLKWDFRPEVPFLNRLSLAQLQDKIEQIPGISSPVTYHPSHPSITYHPRDLRYKYDFQRKVPMLIPIQLFFRFITSTLDFINNSVYLIIMDIYL